MHGEKEQIPPDLVVNARLSILWRLFETSSGDETRLKIGKQQELKGRVVLNNRGPLVHH